jgi:transmembrane sensor
MMEKTDTSANAIDVEAVTWVTRLDGESETERTREELEAWLARDPRHRGAYLRARAAWTSLDRLQILTGHSLGPEPSRLTRRRVMAASGGAAALAATVASVAFVLADRDRIATPIGEIRRVPLNDGSLVAVNTNSRLDVDLKPDLRRLTLDKGEVWFQVAKDKKRPFVVAAGEVRVRAVGTAFSVRRHDDGADVLVTEGVVETWTVDDARRKARVSAGSKVFVSDIAGPSRIVPAGEQIDRALAWRNGEIALDGQTLAAAAAEFNRYNTRRLTIDPSLADKRLVGWFHTNEPETFARAAAATLNVAMTTDEDEIHLAPKTEQ